MTSASDEDTFREDWGFPSEVRATITDAGLFDIRPTGRTFKSGRQVFEAIFINRDRTKVVARREAMQLTSKRTGQDYFVCRRNGNQKQVDAARAVDDVLASIVPIAAAEAVLG